MSKSENNASFTVYVCVCVCNFLEIYSRRIRAVFCSLMHSFTALLTKTFNARIVFALETLDETLLSSLTFVRVNDLWWIYVTFGASPLFFSLARVRLSSNYVQFESSSHGFCFLFLIRYDHIILFWLVFNVTISRDTCMRSTKDLHIMHLMPKTFLYDTKSEYEQFRIILFL